MTLSSVLALSASVHARYEMKYSSEVMSDKNVFLVI